MDDPLEASQMPRERRSEFNTQLSTDTEDRELEKPIKGLDDQRSEPEKRQRTRTMRD